jgi:hypothetical protein
MKLIQYRDAHMQEHVYFWVNIDDIQISPTFTNEGTANDWLAHQRSLDWDNWKPCRDLR